MTIRLQAFIERYPPSRDCRPATAEQVERYRGDLPEALLELWRTVGFGFYGGGLIQLVDPDRYRELLWGWLLCDENMRRLPIALGAFGDIFYYRLLSDEGDEDVSFLDPHTSDVGDLAWSLEDFFNDWCCDESVTRDFLGADLLREAVARQGALAPDQIYLFTPALRLGGRRTCEHLGKGDAAVHLDFLLQLALQ